MQLQLPDNPYRTISFSLPFSISCFLIRSKQILRRFRSCIPNLSKESRPWFRGLQRQYDSTSRTSGARNQPSAMSRPSKPASRTCISIPKASRLRPILDRTSTSGGSTPIHGRSTACHPTPMDRKHRSRRHDKLSCTFTAVPFTARSTHSTGN